MNLPKDFFLGGNATFTVQNPAGEHYTFKVKANEFNGHIYHGVSLMTGPDNENSYNYIGTLNTFDGSIRLTAKSKFDWSVKPVRVAAFALRVAWGVQQLPEGYQIRHEGKCGCCGRKLTEPTSLDFGIGPECRKRLGI